MVCDATPTGPACGDETADAVNTIAVNAEGILCMFVVQTIQSSRVRDGKPAITPCLV